MSRAIVVTRGTNGHSPVTKTGSTLLADLADPTSKAKLDARFRAAFTGRGMDAKIRANLKRLAAVFARAPKLSKASIDRIANTPYDQDGD